MEIKVITIGKNRTRYQFYNDLIVAVSAEERPQFDDDKHVRNHPHSPLSPGSECSSQVWEEGSLVDTALRRWLIVLHSFCGELRMDGEAENESEIREGAYVTSTVETLDLMVI